MPDPILDALDDPNEEVEPVEEKEESQEVDTDESEESAEEVEEEDESEETEEDETEEEPEEEKLPSQYHRSSFKEIKEKYPTFFKDFPDMREVYFREREFTNLFPTVEDAQESLSQAQAFVAIERDLKQGSIKSLYEALADTDKNAAVKMAENFLPQIYEKSPDLYFNVINPILEMFIRQVHDEGDRSGNDNLKAAAKWVAKFAWNHTDIEKLGIKTKTADPQIEAEKTRLANERAAFEDKKYQDVHNAVSARTQKFFINAIVKDIPSDKIDDDYVRQNVVKDIYAKCMEVLSADPAHMKLMNSMWQKAQREGFLPESRDRLVSTFLARAKRILPAVRKEVISQLKGRKNTVPKTKPVAGGRVSKDSSNGSERSESGKKFDYSKYSSDTDLLNDLLDKKVRA